MLNYMDVYKAISLDANNYSDLMKVTATETQIEKNSVRRGDVFFTPSSETPEDIGHSIAIDGDFDDLVYSYHLMRYRPEQGILDTSFSNYIFNHITFRRQLIFQSQGAQRYVVNRSGFEKLVVSLPELQEQAKLGQFFKVVDKRITLHQREYIVTNIVSVLINSSKHQTNSINSLFMSDYAYDWEQRKLGDLGTTFNGLSGKTKEDFGIGNGEFVTYLNVFNNSISNIYLTENVEIDKKQNEVKYGDILFTTSSETPHEVGMSSVWLDNRPNVYLNSFCFGYRMTEKQDPFYMAYLLRSVSVRKQFELLAQGISRYNISKVKSMDIEVSVPCLDEQSNIGLLFNEMDKTITLHQRE